MSSDVESSAGPLRVAVVVASLGRPESVAALLGRLAEQTQAPHQVVLSVERPQDLPVLASIPLSIETVHGPRGLPAQRNRGLDMLAPEVDVVVFYDDDFIPSRTAIFGISHFFALHREIAGATGVVLADGVNGPGITIDEARRIVGSFDSNHAGLADGLILERRSALYGCNMAYRTSMIGDARFDEKLPLYAWLEDLDFGGQLSGEQVQTDAFSGVHCGVKEGRERNGMRLGYSQVCNPAYLARKGTLSRRSAWRFCLRNVVANHLKMFRPEPWIDRAGRARGNWRAIGDLIRGDLDPGRILDLGQPTRSALLDDVPSSDRIGPPRKIAVVGIPFSENVGDGVIADCIEWCLKADFPDVELNHVDLAGRSAPGHNVVAARSTLLDVLDVVPGLARRLVVRAALWKVLRHSEPRLASQIATADLVLISGGQLFSDADLNFPLKVGRIADLANVAGKPVAIAAAGVSPNWTTAGSRLFRRLSRCELHFVGLRDQPSIAAWQVQFAVGPSPELVRDPGLLARYCYPAASEEADRPVGIGVTCMRTLLKHADRPIAGSGRKPTSENLLAFFRNFTVELVRRGYRVRLFCNGAGDDSTMVRSLSVDPELAGMIDADRVEVGATPCSGQELASLISSCRAVVAHRLHASIVAYSYSIPIVGLSWDRKLDSFFDSVDLGHLVIRDPIAETSAVADLLDGAMRDGIEAEHHEAVLKECRHSLLRVWMASGLARPEVDR